jgi:ParB family transcriptional regulator, chromosome partitioning protein
MAAKKNALGRGLSALMVDEETASRNNSPSGHDELDMSLIEANPFQPRTRFEEESLNELAASIRELGVIQPVIVRHKGDGRYQLIAGERRFRAASIIGLETIPAFVRTADDQALLEMALVENIQREDLDAIEIAISYQRLIDECDLTQEALSERVGKKRSTIANYIRLLRLPAEIQLGIKHGQISMGHARCIISIDDPSRQLSLYKRIIGQDLSVRRVEELVREMSDRKTGEASRTPARAGADEYNSLRNHLTGFFGTNVEFKCNEKGKGRIIIPFDTSEDLERIIGLLDSLNT